MRKQISLAVIAGIFISVIGCSSAKIVSVGSEKTFSVETTTPLTDNWALLPTNKVWPLGKITLSEKTEWLSPTADDVITFNESGKLLKLPVKQTTRFPVIGVYSASPSAEKLQVIGTALNSKNISTPVGGTYGATVGNTNQLCIVVNNIGEPILLVSHLVSETRFAIDGRVTSQSIWQPSGKTLIAGDNFKKGLTFITPNIPPTDGTLTYQVWLKRRDSNNIYLSLSNSNNTFSREIVVPSKNGRYAVFDKVSVDINVESFHKTLAKLVVVE